MVKLVVLGCLAQRPMHGYEIKKQIERYFGEALPVRHGSIYHALRRLAEQDLAEPVEPEPEGTGPEKHTYRITAAGRSRFLQDLRRKMLADQPRPDPFGVLLGFAHLLEPQEIREALEIRIQRLREAQPRLRDKRRSLMAGGSPLARYMSLLMDRSRLHVEVESYWIEGILDHLADPGFLGRDDQGAPIPWEEDAFPDEN